MSEFVNQYMYDFRSVHVGKDLFRAKTKEEDIKIINELTNEERSEAYFRSVTGGWIDYSINDTLVELFAHGLVASERGHLAALAELKTDIAHLKRNAGGAT